MAVQETRSGRKIFPPVAYWLGEQLNSGTLTFASSIVLNAKHDRHLIPNRIQSRLEEISPELKNNVINESFTLSDDGILKFSNKKSKRITTKRKRQCNNKNSKSDNANLMDTSCRSDCNEHDSLINSASKKIKGRTLKSKTKSKISGASKKVSPEFSIRNEINKRKLPTTTPIKNKNVHAQKSITQPKSDIKAAASYSCKSELDADHSSCSILQQSSTDRDSNLNCSIQNKNSQSLRSYNSSKKINSHNSAVKLSKVKPSETPHIKKSSVKRPRTAHVDRADWHTLTKDSAHNLSFPNDEALEESSYSDSKLQRRPLQIVNKTITGKRLAFSVTDGFNKNYSGDIYEKTSKQNKLPKSVINFLNETSIDEDISTVKTPKPSFHVVPTVSKIKTPLTSFPFKFPTPLSPNKRVRLCRSNASKRIFVNSNKALYQDAQTSKVTTKSRVSCSTVDGNFSLLINSSVVKETSFKDDVESDLSSDDMNFSNT